MDFDDLDAAEEAEAEQQAESERKAAEELKKAQEEKAEALRKAADEQAAKAAERAAEQAAQAAEAAAAAPAKKIWQPLTEEEWTALPPLGRNGAPTNMKEFKAVANESLPGEYWGIEFPHSPAMLREMGPKWLTKALHLTGVLPKDNEVTKFTRFDVKAEDVTKEDAENAKWGGAGLKILLNVEYKNGPGNLTEGMFIKMPHPFTGKNERFKNSVTSAGMDWSEVTWYNLFAGKYGQPEFRSPRMYFCDMNRKTTNFVNIVEMVEHGPHGKAEVLPGRPFPPPEKYKDYDLPNNGIDYYYAHARCLAEFFGWYRMNKAKTNQIDELFMAKEGRDLTNGLHQIMGGLGPYGSDERNKGVGKALQDPQCQGIAASMFFPQQSCQGFLELGKDFVTSIAPHAFPKDVMGKAHLDTFFKEALEMSHYCQAMQFHVQSIPEYFTLVHPNAQVDNAWYWREMDGTVKAGLLDWGGVNCGNIAACIGNGWIGMEPEVADEHEEKMVKFFIDEFEKVAGFRFDFDDLYMHIKLAQGMTLYGCCANVGMLLRIISRDKWKDVKGRTDPRIDHLFLARCYFVQIQMYLAMWKKRSPYKYYKTWKQKTGIQ